MPIDERGWRAIMASWASGVSVVTSLGARGPRGATATALTSLSVEPLLLLVCFDRASNTLQAVRESGRFAVNVLSERQEEVARRFARKEPEDAKFAGIGHALAHGAPVIDGCLAWAVCAVDRELEGGDHAIVIGRPLEGGAAEGMGPLLYYRRGYRRLS